MTKIKDTNEPWQSGMAKNITFIVTKDCQLACKYCYLVGKNVKERMPWEVAKTFIDYVLDHETDPDFAYESVVWDSRRNYIVEITIGSIATASPSPPMASTTTKRPFRTSSRRTSNTFPSASPSMGQRRSMTLTVCIRLPKKDPTRMW